MRRLAEDVVAEEWILRARDLPRQSCDGGYERRDRFDRKRVLLMPQLGDELF